MEGIFSLAECVLSRYSNDEDVFSCIRILVKEILDLRETLEFCELQIHQEKSAEPADHGFGLDDKENFGPTRPVSAAIPKIRSSRFNWVEDANVEHRDLLP